MSYTVSRGREGCSRVGFASVSYLQCVTAASRLWRVKARQVKGGQVKSRDGSTIGVFVNVMLWSR